MHLFLSILESWEFSKGFNDTFLVLIPKKEKSQYITQLRPSGHCNMACKVMAKVLMNRVKSIFDKLIAPTKSSFVLGHQI